MCITVKSADGVLKRALKRFAVLVGAGNADAAKALVTYLRSVDAAKVLKAKGMEPG